MFRTALERKIYAEVTAALAYACAREVLTDGAGQAHRIQDAAWDQVLELRTRVTAARLRRRSKPRRALRITRKARR